MKAKHIFTLYLPGLLCLLLNEKLSAQAFRGRWLAEGSIGNVSWIERRNDRTERTYAYWARNFSTVLSPGAGYFMTDNWMLGAALNLQLYSGRVRAYTEWGARMQSGSSRGSRLNCSPFLRYYFTPGPATRFYVQLGGAAGFILSDLRQTISYNNYGVPTGTDYIETEGQSYSGRIAVGMNHFFTSSLALHSSIGYSYERNRSKTIYTNDYMLLQESNISKFAYIEHRLIWNFGFSFLIPKKRDRALMNWERPGIKK